MDIDKNARFLISRGDDIPEKMCLYFLHNLDKEIVYIGSTINLLSRLKKHCCLENSYMLYKKKEGEGIMELKIKANDLRIIVDYLQDHRLSKYDIDSEDWKCLVDLENKITKIVGRWGINESVKIKERGKE